MKWKWKDFCHVPLVIVKKFIICKSTPKEFLHLFPGSVVRQSLNCDLGLFRKCIGLLVWGHFIYWTQWTSLQPAAASRQVSSLIRFLVFLLCSVLLAFFGWPRIHTICRVTHTVPPLVTPWNSRNPLSWLQWTPYSRHEQYHFFTPIAIPNIFKEALTIPNTYANFIMSP